jgi:hypothetical protein
MNELLRHYTVDIEFPHVSGAEHLEMLQIRDKLFEIEAALPEAEKTILADADRRLVERAAEFYAELSQFIDFEQRRQTQKIPVKRWWWYLDVLAQLPNPWPLTKPKTVTV